MKVLIACEESQVVCKAFRERGHEACFSGERWASGRMDLREKAFEFFKMIYNAPIKRKCIENSHSIFLNREFKKPTQSIHPYHFGDGFKKLTCLWLVNLKPLIELHVHHKRYIAGRMAWEYPNEYLITLCNECHGKLHGKIDDFRPARLKPSFVYAE